MSYTINSGHFQMNGHQDMISESHSYSGTYNSAYNHKPQNVSEDAEMGFRHTSSLDHELWQYIQIKHHPNGGASIVHMDRNDFSGLSSDKTTTLADMFLKEVFREESECSPVHVMGVIHNAASFLPEMIDYFACNHPDVVVKMGNLKNSEIETTTFSEFATRVKNSYCNGTMRCGPLLQVSLVGQVSEEAGRYFPEFLG